MVTLNVPEIRDYQRINRTVQQALDAGAARIRLDGVEGQRLLLHGLRGPWHATIDVDGDAGPELAQGMEAGGVTVVCHGNAADGAGAELRHGRLLIRGTSGVGVGFDQAGGTIVALGDVGARAGLHQRGGVLVISGAAGAFAGERQHGGLLVLVTTEIGRHLGHAQRGGQIVPGGSDAPLPADVRSQIEECLFAFDGEATTELRRLLAKG